MTVPLSKWLQYIDMLAAVNDTAAAKFTEYLNTHDTSTAEGMNAAIEYGYGLAAKYGESAAALSCEMYDAIAEASAAAVPPAVPAPTATRGDIAKTINGMRNHGYSNEAIGSGIGRLVKRTGVDTTLKNAIRDQAQYAWIPHGDTCPYCMMLASYGWMWASKKALDGDHAEHVHANCDCTYAIRFDDRTTYAGYRPEHYKQIIDDAEGDTVDEKLNSIRRAEHAEDPEKDNARKRELYAAEQERLKKPVHTDTPKYPDTPVYRFRDVTNDMLKKSVPNSHSVSDITSFVQDGASYTVDGKDIHFNYNTSEKQIAELLSRELGGEIRMMPKVEKPERVQTPDYIFRGQRWDLKAMRTSTSKNAVYNRINECQDQADHFVLDITGNPLEQEELFRQAGAIFLSRHTRRVQSIILIDNGVIVKILERL